MIKIVYRSVVVPLLLACCLMVVSPCFASTPKETMEKAVGEIMTVLQDGDSSDETVWQGQRERVSAIVSSRFDMREMAKRSLSKYWKKRSAAEQDNFAELFSELIKNTYIGRLRGYSGAKDGTRFDKEIVRGNKSAVSSVIWQNSQEVSVVYKLYQKGDDWLVYDVVIENVSMIRNYRSQFAQIMHKNSYDVLVGKIQEKLSDPSVDGDDDFVGK